MLRIYFYFTYEWNDETWAPTGYRDSMLSLCQSQRAAASRRIRRRRARTLMGPRPWSSCRRGGRCHLPPPPPRSSRRPSIMRRRTRRERGPAPTPPAAALSRPWPLPPPLALPLALPYVYMDDTERRGRWLRRGGRRGWARRFWFWPCWLASWGTSWGAS